jgi:copper transport protein
VNATERFDTGGPGGAGTVDVAVTPARLGTDQVTLTFHGTTGQLMRPAQVTAALVLSSEGLGPLPVTLTPNGPGTYKAPAVTFTFTGNWQLQVTVRTDNFDETTVVVPVNVHQ